MSWLALVILAAAIGCSDDKKDGGLAVVVESDLSMPKDIDRVRFEVSQEGRVLRTEDHLLGEGQLLMPAEFKVKPVGNSSPVLIRAIGLKGGIGRIERSVITTVPADFVAMVRLPLTYLCAGTAREDGTSTCGDGQTCKLGLCQPSAIDATTLPVYQPGPWTGSESASRDPSASDCFDVLNCFSQAYRVEVDRNTCTFVVDNDDPANISVGIKLPQGSDGICGAGSCWIALDQGSEGWTNEGTIFKLPDALCRDRSDGTKLVIVASNMCGGKTLSTPPCGTWSSATHPADTSESIGTTEDGVMETPGDPVGASCAGLSYQPCGDCGQQRRTCKNGTWSDWGECLGQGVCTPNASEMCGSDGMRVCLSTCDWDDCSGQTCAGNAVEACGNCGTRRRTCTNGEWSEWGECENSGPCAPGMTQACGVGGTQACMGNCQWGTCGTEVCPGAPSQACGNCGTQSRTCNADTMQWDAFGACGQEGACEANQTRTCGLRGMQTCGGNCQWDASCTGQICEGPASQPCGMCGVQTRTCDSNTGLWSPWGACMSEGVCTPGTTVSCGVGGSRICLNSCVWSEECTGQVCAGPMTESCGNCGTRSRECDQLTATWKPWGACTNTGPCNPGSTRRCGTGGTQTCTASCQWPNTCLGQSCPGESTRECLNCGTESRICNGSTGMYGGWGNCTGQGPCTPGDVESCGALKERVCQDTCQFDKCHCVAGATVCGDLCVNLKTDSQHCGSCDNDCHGRPCDNGVCRACDSGQHNCNGTCRPNSDVRWCGSRPNEDCDACTLPGDAAKGAVTTCNGTDCGWTCPGGTNLCNPATPAAACVDRNDRNNCGACGTVCPADQNCVDGRCTCLGGGRVGTNDNCSECGDKCDEGTMCRDKKCQCRMGELGSPANCGTCGNACSAPPHATATCSAQGTCGFTCNAPYYQCSNGNACGSDDDEAACGRSCAQCGAGQQCIDGTCTQTSCGSGEHVCNNQCVENNDVAHCGNSCSPCDAPANSRPTCDGRNCGHECNDNAHACNDGSCALDSDNSKCTAECKPCPGKTNARASCSANGMSCVYTCEDGTCGPNCTRCTAPEHATPTCSAQGDCGFTCNSPYYECTNGRGCGSDDDESACGRSCEQCGSGQQCIDGNCRQTSCGEGQHVCDNQCVDDDDIAHCGDSCSACKPPPNSRATCDGRNCGYECNENAHACNDGSCALDSDASKCTADCKPCPSRQNASATCSANGMTCEYSCNRDTCGPNCTKCDAGFSCVDDTCQRTSCESNDQHLCGDKCVDNDSIENCGQSCSACPKPPNNARATCDGRNCGFECEGGFHRCRDNTCASDTDVKRCGDDCSPCPEMDDNTVECVANACRYTPINSSGGDGGSMSNGGMGARGGSNGGGNGESGMGARGGMNAGGMNAGGMNASGTNAAGMGMGGGGMVAGGMNAAGMGMGGGGMNAGGMNAAGMGMGGGGMNAGGMSAAGMDPNTAGGMSDGDMSGGGMSAGGMNAAGMDTSSGGMNSDGDMSAAGLDASSSSMSSGN